MTEGEKRCGLVSFLPMSCRGRAEAFARRLHNRLRSLGSQDDDINSASTSENTWLSNNETANTVTSLQPRNESDIFMDFSIFDTPGSPQEEHAESELSKFITNTKDDLHHFKLDECTCITENCQVGKRNSLDSDSSDGAYFDSENLEPPNGILNNHVNGINQDEEDEIDISSILSIPSNCSTEPNKDLLEEHLIDDELGRDEVSTWCFIYEPNTISNKNNNVYSAINLESLKCSKTNSQEEIETDNKESYCSHLNIQQDLTIECSNSIKPLVEISTIEIIDIDATQFEYKEEDSNHLKVESIVCETENDIEEERIPRVRRCSSLKTGKTPPDTPGRKKIVRFADVLGLDLADVRTFLDEIPKVPISAYDDLSGVDISLSDNSLSSVSSGSDSFHSSSKTLVPLFQQPGGEANFMEKIRKNQVCLENAVLKDSIDLCVCGTVRVRNLDFHKSVHIRYSIDAWKSFADLQATYVDNTCDGFSDKFSFTLYVHTLNIGQRLEFAVRFQCKGCQYWDNNGGENYCFQCLPVCTNNSFVPITTPDDINWAGAAFY